MKTLLATFALAGIAMIVTIASAAHANPIAPYNPAPVCQKGFVPTQLPDASWRCVPRYM